MGGLTISLVEGYPLNLELDSKETYLVYRDIPTTDEEDDLSLDNLKVRERGRKREVKAIPTHYRMLLASWLYAILKCCVDWY